MGPVASLGGEGTRDEGTMARGDDGMREQGNEGTMDEGTMERWNEGVQITAYSCFKILSGLSNVQL